jgi:hypothetical protein
MGVTVKSTIPERGGLGGMIRFSSVQSTENFMIVFGNVEYLLYICTIATNDN